LASGRKEGEFLCLFLNTFKEGLLEHGRKGRGGGGRGDAGGKGGGTLKGAKKFKKNSSP